MKEEEQDKERQRKLINERMNEYYSQIKELNNYSIVDINHSKAKSARGSNLGEIVKNMKVSASARLLPNIGKHNNKYSSECINNVSSRGT